MNGRFWACTASSEDCLHFGAVVTDHHATEDLHVCQRSAARRLSTLRHPRSRRPCILGRRCTCRICRKVSRSGAMRSGSKSHHLAREGRLTFASKASVGLTSTGILFEVAFKKHVLLVSYQKAWAVQYLLFFEEGWTRTHHCTEDPDMPAPLTPT